MIKAYFQAVTYKAALCILHSESPIGDPSILIDGSTETLVIENGCSPLPEAPLFVETAGLEQGNVLTSFTVTHIYTVSVIFGSLTEFPLIVETTFIIDMAL